MDENKNDGAVMSERDRERFEAKIEKPEEPDGCWTWKGKPNKDGYGRFTAGGVTDYSHRWSHRLYVGPIPEGADVRHHPCGNAACVRPDHLEPGSRRENNLDTLDHGRHRTAKLDNRRARGIREKYARDRPPQKDLARQEGLSVSAISDLLRGKSWPRAGGPTKPS
jgi:hypothetical protein